METKQDCDTLLWYHGLKKSIPKMWWIWLEDNSYVNMNKEYITVADIVVSKQICHSAYEFRLNRLPTSKMYRYVEKWYDMMGMENQGLNGYYKLFCDLDKITNITKLRSFQYRLLLKQSTGIY